MVDPPLRHARQHPDARRDARRHRPGVAGGGTAVHDGPVKAWHAAGAAPGRFALVLVVQLVLVFLGLVYWSLIREARRVIRNRPGAMSATGGAATLPA